MPISRDEKQGAERSEPTQLSGAVPEPAAGAAPDDWRGFLAWGFASYSITSLVVLLAVIFAARFVRLCRVHPSASDAGLIKRCAAWDGEWYARIVAEGYSYAERRMSSVAFFPAYPLAARVVAAETGLEAEQALLIVSHGFLVAAFALLAAYVRRRTADADGETVAYALVAFGLFPTTLYFRMAYSESMFGFFALLAMYGMAVRWRTVAIALVIGLTTATRPVGVALLLPFAIDLWQRSAGGTVHERARSLCLRLPALLLACWGIVAYMAYLDAAFGEPLAFAKTQVHWQRRDPPETAAEKVWGLATLAPIRDVYRPGSPCHWKRDPPGDTPLFSGTFLNPIYFLFTAGMVGLGAARGWLTGKELLLSAGLLLIPYAASGDCQCMASEMRYSSAVFPLYIALAHALRGLPLPFAVMLAATSAVLLAMHTALFTSWYWFY